MRKYGLFCPIRQPNPYRRMARNLRTSEIAPDLVQRRFRKEGPGKILLTDITYIRLDGGQFVYLSVIKDAFTMQVLAYVLSDSLKVDFVLMTVKKLLQNRCCAIGIDTILHSDQGCHYTSVAFRELLTNVELRQSMSRKGNCWDNAPQESFFGHMKEELKPYRKGWKTIQDVRARIDDWMDYYNNDRCQTILGGLAPNEYYTYITTEQLPADMAAEKIR